MYFFNEAEVLDGMYAANQTEAHVHIRTIKQTRNNIKQMEKQVENLRLTTAVGSGSTGKNNQRQFVWDGLKSGKERWKRGKFAEGGCGNKISGESNLIMFLQFNTELANITSVPTNDKSG